MLGSALYIQKYGGAPMRVGKGFENLGAFRKWHLSSVYSVCRERKKKKMVLNPVCFRSDQKISNDLFFQFISFERMPIVTVDFVFNG